MKAYSFGLATAATLFLSQISGPGISSATATSIYLLDQATFTINQSGRKLTFEIVDSSPTAIDRIEIHGKELVKDESERYSYDMGQEPLTQVLLTSELPSISETSQPLSQVTSKLISVRNLGLSDIATAQSLSATKTRIRYQTFIENALVEVPIVGCSAGTEEAQRVINFFAGNSRTWNADSNSYKTRFDSLISWNSPHSVEPQVAVGTTAAYQYFQGQIVYAELRTAPSTSMILTPGDVSENYVSFRIQQNVANPFCEYAGGIYFDFHLYVKRDGTFTLKGKYKPVPHHEVYVRDNLDTSWRTILREGSERFECFIPVYTNVCPVPAEIRGQF